MSVHLLTSGFNVLQMVGLVFPRLGQNRGEQRVTDQNENKDKKVPVDQPFILEQLHVLDSMVLLHRQCFYLPHHARDVCVLFHVLGAVLRAGCDQSFRQIHRRDNRCLDFIHHNYHSLEMRSIQEQSP